MTTAAGNERKTTGSYYTPDSLVKELIKSALDPVIEARLAENAEAPEKALLSMAVIDPACGSGHFLFKYFRSNFTTPVQATNFSKRYRHIKMQAICWFNFYKALAFSILCSF